MSNPFDQFDSGATTVKTEPTKTTPKREVDTELTWAEKNIAKLLPKFLEGNLRGSFVGRAMMGAADPGVAIAQLAGNAIGKGEQINSGISDTEAKYQAARESAGSSGFDPVRMAGNIAITAPLSLGAGAAKTLIGQVAKGAAQGAAFSALQPITENGEYWKNKGEQIATGAALGGVTAPIVNAVSRVIQPNTNPNVSLLQKEGVKPTIGQAAGGWVDRLEEKAQSLPLLGDAIKSAREKSISQFDTAAFNRASAPIGETIKERGSAGIAELSKKLGAEYERVIPKLSVDVNGPAFVQKMASLRALVQSMPDKERAAFDTVLRREIDERLAPNGMLSGQNLKNAWNALRDNGQRFSKSNDAYQADLGQAFKQAFQELKDHVIATNPADDVAKLRNVDFGYANFKRLQKAASSLAAEDGNFSPSQLHSAVKALDNSKDKGRFAKGEALMQDLSSAGKQVLSAKFPNSGTYDRAIMGGLVLGSPLAPQVTLPILAGLGISAGAYSAPIQNMLVALLTKRPDLAPAVANQLNKLAGPITAGVISAQNQQ